MVEKRYSILTFIFGRYEQIREVQNIDPEAEYILVTDDKELKSDTWNIFYDTRLDELSVIDKCYYVRYHPFEYCNTDICFRIDGSIKIKDSLADIINVFEETVSDIMIMLNPVHNYLHKDYKQWIETRGYPKEAADRAMTLMNNLGYNMSYKGYYQIGVSIERKNKRTRDLNDITYSILNYLGTENQIERFDQPIWSFVLNKFFEKTLRVMPVTEYLITCSKYLQWCVHNSGTPIPFKTEMKPPYLFNELVECYNFDNITKDETNGVSYVLNEVAKLRLELEQYKTKHHQILKDREYLTEQNQKLNKELEEKDSLLTAYKNKIEEDKNVKTQLKCEIDNIKSSKIYRLSYTLSHPLKWIKRNTI
ncbi:MAG: hypothetical protein Q4E63_01545 [Prevotellaceae bacterium]|nr:hypothetical protein [Prevotellaceae bacterium]